eukprot:3307553-Rhodomonas_salina.1
MQVPVEKVITKYIEVPVERCWCTVAGMRSCINVDQLSAKVVDQISGKVDTKGGCGQVITKEVPVEVEIFVEK